MEFKSARARLAEDLSDFLTADPDKLGLKTDPEKILRLSYGPADPWQSEVLRSDAPRICICCARQVGKSTVVSACALRTALVQPNALVLLLSSGLRQSGELLRDKVCNMWASLGSPLKKKMTQLSLEFSNGSRILSLPADEATVRGYSAVALCVLDEARTMDDSIMASVSPMLSISKGQMIVLSTPLGRQGFFWEIMNNPEGWKVIQVRGDECPRISAEFLAQEHRILGDRMYRQEYENSFNDLQGALLDYAAVMDMKSAAGRPLFALGA